MYAHVFGDARFWLYLAAWIPYTAFVVLYATRSPWYVSWLGRSLLLSKTVIAVLLTHILLVLVLRGGPPTPAVYPGEVVVRIFLVGGVICAGWVQLAYLIRAQREQRHNRPADLPRRRSTDL